MYEYALSLQASRAETRLTVYRAHPSFIAQRRANRAEHAWRIFQKYVHVFMNISRLRGQILVKSFLDGVKVY